MSLAVHWNSDRTTICGKALQTTLTAVRTPEYAPLRFLRPPSADRDHAATPQAVRMRAVEPVPSLDSMSKRKQQLESLDPDRSKDERAFQSDRSKIENINNESLRCELCDPHLMLIVVHLGKCLPALQIKAATPSNGFQDRND